MNSYPDIGSIEPIGSVVAAGAGAAGLVEAAFTQREDQPKDQRMGLVRDLAEDIKDQLESLAHSAASEPSPDLMAEAALRCADLANLAACNLDGLAAEEAARATAGVHLAAGTIRAFRLLAQGPGDLSEPGAAALRDLRGAGWRVDLAVRQVEALLEPAEGG